MPGGPPIVTAADAARACGGVLHGDAARPVRAVRALEKAGPEDLAFVADAKAERAAAASAAGVLLVRSRDRFAGRDVIETPDPASAVIEVLKRLHPPRVARPGIHPTAVVEEGATVAASAEIGPFVVVGAGSAIGDAAILEAHAVVGRACSVGRAARLHPHVVLYDAVSIGDRVEIHSGAVIGADGFGYVPAKDGIRKVPQVGTVVLEADVEIGANSCVDRASLEVTRIGAGTKVDDLVMVGHNCDVGRHGFLCAQTGLAGSSILGDGVVLGGQVGVGGHLRIGNGVRVGAQSGVNGDVPDGASINGSPHLSYRDSMKSLVEYRRLPETARLVRELAGRAGLAIKDDA